MKYALELISGRAYYTDSSSPMKVVDTRGGVEKIGVLMPLRTGYDFDEPVAPQTPKSAFKEPEKKTTKDKKQVIQEKENKKAEISEKRKQSAKPRGQKK